MLTVGNANDDYYGPGPFSGAAITNLWGLSVVESENITAGTALVGDGLMAAVVDRMDATIYTTDSHSDFFIRNILVILAEERIALPVFRPEAFAAVDLV
jgi:HK97 family phage major capsid protein